LPTFAPAAALRPLPPELTQRRPGQSPSQAGVDSFVSDEVNVRSLHHRIRRFYHRDEPHTFNHSNASIFIILQLRIVY